MNLLLIDNYDSFTYNLRHLLLEAGAKVDVVRNDQFSLDLPAKYDKIVLSPGPGIPSEAGLLMDVIKEYAASKPILGVCLGHQAIGEAFGAKLENLSSVFHGVQTPCQILSHDDLFKAMADTIEIGRYHSWVVSRDGLPACLEVTAESPEGQIMALRHKSLPIYGIQFHPESVLTPEGRTIIDNFLNI